jgi:hypothetical protein
MFLRDAIHSRERPMAGQGEAHPEQETPADRRGSSGIARPDYRKWSGAKPLPSMMLFKLWNQTTAPELLWRWLRPNSRGDCPGVANRRALHARPGARNMIVPHRIGIAPAPSSPPALLSLSANPCGRDKRLNSQARLAVYSLRVMSLP